MPGPRIKICGVTSPAALDAAIAARADHIGLVFYPPSPRCLTLAQAAELGERAAGRIGRVGLFVRSGTQLAGARQLDYSVHTGVRYLFRLGKSQ